MAAPLAPTRPTLTALPTSIEVTLPADPASDSPITSRDIQWRRATHTFFNIVDSITSPHTVENLLSQIVYEVQWRAVSSEGDGAWSSSRDIATLAPDEFPMLAAISDIDLEQGTALSMTLPAATSGDLPITYTVTGLPAGMLFNVSTRLLTWPAQSASASHTLTYTATDTDGDDATRSFVVRVLVEYSDWSTNRITRLLMAVNRGTSDWYQEGVSGSLFDGSNALFDDVLVAGLRINRIRWLNGDILLNRDGATDFSTQFGADDSPLADGIWHIVTSEGEVLLTNSILDQAGGGFARWMPTVADDIAFIGGIGEDDRFLLAFTIPPTVRNVTAAHTLQNVARAATAGRSPSIGFTTAASIVEGGSSTTITGTVQDAEDDDGDVTVTAATSLGTVSTPVNTNGTWSLTLTAPAVTAGQQDMAVTVTAEDTGGLTATATRTWMVRANQGPTAMITTAGGAQTPGSTIALAGTVTGPEPGQTITVLWEITGGTATLTNPTSLTNASIALQGLTVAAQTIDVRFTATDPHNLIAIDTVQFTIRAALAPVSPDAPVLTVPTHTSIVAALTDPTSDLPITSRDIRYRVTGTTVWTTNTGVAYPYTISSLTASTQYSVEAQVHSAAGASGWGDDATATTRSGLKTVAVTFPGAGGSFTTAVTKITVGAPQQVAASFAGIAGFFSIVLQVVAGPGLLEITFPGAGGSFSAAVTKTAAGTQPVGVTFPGIGGSFSAAVTKTALSTQPVGVTFPGIGGSLAAAVTVVAFPLALSDYGPVTGHDTVFAGLITSGGAVLYRNDDPSTDETNDSGTLDDGDTEIQPGQQVSRIRRFSSNVLLLNDDPSPIFIGDYFDTGIGATGRIYLQTAQETQSFAVADSVVGSGGDFVNFAGLTEDFDDLLASITLGERFILAFSLPALEDVAAAFPGIGGSFTAAVQIQQVGGGAVAATFIGIAGFTTVEVQKVAAGQQPVGVTFPGAGGSFTTAVTKTALGTQPVEAAFPGIGAGGSFSAAVTIAEIGFQQVAVVFDSLVGTFSVSVIKSTLATQPVAAAFPGIGGSFSAAVGTGVPSLMPLPPRALRVTTLAQRISWLAVAGAESYELQYREFPDDWITITGIISTTHLVGGLEPGRTYEWRVRSFTTGAGASEWSEITELTNLSVLDVMDVRQFADLILPQYGFSTSLVTLIEALLLTLQTQLVGAIDSVESQLSIESAEGAWLDFIGTRIGLQRPHVSSTGVGYFGFADDNVGFDQGPMWDLAAALRDRVPVVDDQYRSLLRGRALSLRLGASVPDIEAVASATFTGGGYVEEGSGTITLKVTENRVGLRQLATDLEIIPRPAGVELIVEDA